MLFSLLLYRHGHLEVGRLRLLLLKWPTRTHLLANIPIVATTLHVVVKHAAPSLPVVVVLVHRLSLRVTVLTGTARCSNPTSTLPLLHLLHLEALLLKLLSLAILRDLSKQLEQREQKLSLFRPEVITELLELLHVLLDFFALLVASEFKLVNSLEHVGLSLLSCLKLADEERAATEGPL